MAESIGACPSDPLALQAFALGEFFTIMADLEEPPSGAALDIVRFLEAPFPFVPSALALPEAVRAIKFKEEGNILGLQEMKEARRNKLTTTSPTLLKETDGGNSSRS